MAHAQYVDFFGAATRDRVLGKAPIKWRTPQAPDAILFNFGDPFPESFPNRELADTYKEALDLEPDRVLQYGAGQAAESLRSFLISRAASRGIIVEESEVVVTGGSSQALDLICRVFLNPGDVIMCEAPTFMGALKIFDNYSVHVLGCQLDDMGLQTTLLAQRLDERRRKGFVLPKFLYTIANFQNPSGVTLSLDRRRQLLELADRFNFLIIEDDAYGELRFEGEDLPTLKELDSEGRVIHIGTLSKLVAPGVRVGWAFADHQVATQLDLLKPGYNNGMAHSAVGLYCSSIDFDTRVQSLRQSYRDRRDAMLEALEQHMPAGVRWTRPHGGLFVWVELPDHMDAAALTDLAAERGVGYLSGDLFYPDRTGANHMRLSYSLPPIPAIQEGIRRLADVIKNAMG